MEFAVASLSLLIEILAPGSSAWSSGHRSKAAVALLLSGSGGVLLCATLLWSRVFPPAAILCWLVWQISLACLFLSGKSSASRVGLSTMLFSGPLIAWMVVFSLHFGVVQVSSDSGLPLVVPGDWVLYESSFEQAYSSGDLVVIPCRDSSTSQVARVMSGADRSLLLYAGKTCLGETCLPRAELAVQWKGSGVLERTAVEILGGRSYLIHPGASSESGARQLIAGENEVVVLPDNRRSGAMTECAGSALSVNQQRIAGRARYVLFSTVAPERTGLVLQ